MTLLLDTHTALWMVNEHEKLSSNAKAMLLNDAHTLYFSIASLWEIAIKISIGKLSDLSGGVEVFVKGTPIGEKDGEIFIAVHCIVNGAVDW